LDVNIEIISRLSAWMVSVYALLPQPPVNRRHLEPAEWAALAAVPGPTEIWRQWHDLRDSTEPVVRRQMTKSENGVTSQASLTGTRRTRYTYFSSACRAGMRQRTAGPVGRRSMAARDGMELSLMVSEL